MKITIDATPGEIAALIIELRHVPYRVMSKEVEKFLSDIMRDDQP